MTDHPDRIPQHRHCRECGKAFAGDGFFCGDECKGSAGAVAKKKIRRLMLIWLALVAGTIAAVFAFSAAS
ncbi:MAG: DUF2116 family Zn-ribbon domain-containing protein [Candidatus Methanoplasma sp.]|jgi:predicted nucleic acid-binding Zn ribbon protein|nr:DUF2116 family Zn-ribbon domain-containing protein [Candidatus Methanoplasma sp.]